MSIREDFVKEFGEQTASAIETAAEKHENGLHPNKGNDPFKWALMLAISYQCFEVTSYKKEHKIKPSYARISKWIKDYGNLKDYDGDVDFLALVSGAYNKYVPKDNKSKEQR